MEQGEADRHRDGDEKVQMGWIGHALRKTVSNKAQGWSPEADLAAKHR